MQLYARHGSAWEESHVSASLSAKLRPAIGADRTTDSASKDEVLKSPPIGHFVRYSLRATFWNKFHGQVEGCDFMYSVTRAISSWVATAWLHQISAAFIFIHRDISRHLSSFRPALSVWFESACVLSGVNKVRVCVK